MERDGERTTLREALKIVNVHKKKKTGVYIFSFLFGMNGIN